MRRSSGIFTLSPGSQCTAPSRVCAARCQSRPELLGRIGGRVLVVDLGQPLGKMVKGRWGKMRGEGKKGEGSETLVLSLHFCNPSHRFLGDFSWLTLCFWVLFKHLINTKSLTNLIEKRCKQGLPLDLIAFAQDLKWFGHVFWSLVVCVARQAQCTACWVCIAPL